MAISTIEGIIVEKGLSLLINGIDHIVHSQQYAIEAGQEAADTINEQNEAYNNQKTSLNELTTKYSELSKGVQITGNTIKNVSLSDDQYQDFLSTSNQIADVAPSLTRTWDAQGNAILSAGTNVTALNKQVSDYLKLQRSLTYYDARDNIEDQYNGYIASKDEAKETLKGYDENIESARNQRYIASKFSKQIKNNTPSTKIDNFGNKVKYFTLDYDSYEELSDLLEPAIKENLADDENGNYRFVADLSQLSENDIKEISNKASRISDTAASELSGYEDKKVAAQQSLDSEKKKLISSMSAMANTIDSFDNWTDQDKADTFRDQLISMMSSSDSDKLLNDWEKSELSMDEWLRSNIVNPMANANSDQQEMWSKLFEMSPKEGETVTEFAKRRDNVLEAIANFNNNDFWTKGTLAEAFGFAVTDENGELVWNNQKKLNAIKDALGSDDLRGELKKSTPDELELAYSIVTSGDKEALASIDAFKSKWDELKEQSQEDADKASVSLDSMQSKVSNAKANLTSVSSILTETTSTGGVSADNVKLLTSAFSGVTDLKGKEQNLNKLFTTTSEGVKLNIDTLKEYSEYQQDAIDKDFAKGIQYQTKAIKDQNDAITKAKKNLADAITEKKDLSGPAATLSEAEESLKNAQDKYVSYMQSQSEWEATKKQQKELLSYYSQWQTAQSTANAGDKYTNMVTGLKNAKDAYDHGLVGTDDFKTFAALISPSASDDKANFKENYSKAKRYLTEDKKGVNNFLADLKAKGMASYDKSNDRWSFDIDDMNKAARSLGISSEFMQANFGRLRDYGIDNNFISSTEDGISRVKELTSALSEEQKRLQMLKDTDPTNTTAIAQSEKKVNNYKKDLQETQENMSSYTEDIGQSAVDDFNAAAMGVKEYEEAIKNVSKNTNLTADQRAAAIAQIKAKEEELAASAYTTVDALKEADTSALTNIDPETVSSTVGKITQAYKDQNSEVIDLINTLSQYSSEELKGIDFNDGKWDTELGDAEKAVESLCEKLGLTKDQAQAVIEALKETDKLKDSDEDSSESPKSFKEIQKQAKDSQEEFNSLTGRTYKLDFDTTDLDTAHKQVSDLQSEIDRYKDRDGKYHSEISGGKELQDMYTGAISTEQNAEYNSSAISQSKSSSDVVKAAQDFMQAKNEMDVQTQLYQNGMENDLDQATLDANAAFETLQQAQTDSGVQLIDTDNIQTAEDQLLEMSNEEIKTKIGVDSGDVEDALADVKDLQAAGKMGSIDLDFNVDTMSIDDIDSKIQELTQQKNELLIQNDVEGADKVQALISVLQQLHDKQVEVVAQTQGADLVDQLQSRIAELQDKNVSIDAIVQDDKVQSLISEIAALPPEVQIAIGVDESNVGNAEAIKAQIESDPASVNVNYTKGDQEPAEDQKADVNYTIGSQDPPIDKTAKVTYTLGYQAPPSDKVAHVTYIGGKASGTMTSIAHADGTAYNVLNMKKIFPAYAGGHVALASDETALVNEQGKNGHSESIVRDGVWSMIPGGAHFENLKKGDIIFSAQQTDDLLKHGATPGHARTYAQGTTSGVTLASAYSDGTSELDDKIAEVSTRAKDWVDVALDRLERIVNKYQEIAESDYSNYRASEKAYDKALVNIKSQIKSQKNSRVIYENKANEVASAVGLSDDLRQKVQNGTINIESLSEDDKKRVDAYQEWYKKILDCDEALRKLKTSQKDLAKAKVDRVIDAYDTIIGKRENKASYYEESQSLRQAQGKSQAPGSVYEKQMKKQLYYTKEQKQFTDREINSYKKQMANYLKVNGNNKVDPVYQDMKKKLYELQTSAVKLTTEAEKLRAAIQSNREQNKQWKVDRWSRANSTQDAVESYAGVSDNPKYQLSEKGYQEQIKSNARQINALRALRAEKAEYYDTHFSSPDDEGAQEYLDSITQIDQQMLQIGTDTEETKNKIMELRWKPFDEAQDKLSNVITEFQTIQSLLGDSESFYNEDGSFTQNGLTNILLQQKQIDVTKDKIANYRQGLETLEKQYKNGCYSQEEYNQKAQELIEGIQQESASLANLKQGMIDIYETQITKENDLLQENIDKRMEALEAKEDYYNYDKTLKKKSKDINTLKAQIAALEGTSSAAGKARLEKLKADLADAQDDMDDTIHSHKVDMQKSGLQKLQDDSNDNLDNTLSALKRNSDFQESVIKNMCANVKSNYDETYAHLGTVMDNYGAKVSSTFDSMIQKVKDFNKENGKVSAIVKKISTSSIDGASNGQGKKTSGNKTYTNAEKTTQKTYNNNKTSTGAGTETPGKINSETYHLKLNKSTLYLAPGQSYTLKATWTGSAKPAHSKITWSSNKPNVAKVSSSGKVTAVMGVQTSKSADGKTTGTLTGGVTKTFKAVITATGGQDNARSLAKAKCTVHVMPESHLDAIKNYADKTGLKASSSKVQEALQYAYENKAFTSSKSNMAKEGFIKAYLQDWFDSLPSRKSTVKIPSSASDLEKYIMKKGKNVSAAKIKELATIMNISYKTLNADTKSKILKKYKSYGFAKGGIISDLIPADMNTLLGKAIISNGDQGFVGAKVGESVLTEEFTRLLKPSITAMTDFNNMMQQVHAVPSDNSMKLTNEYNFTFNNPVMNSEQNVQQLITKALKDHDKAMVRDFKKLR